MAGVDVSCDFVSVAKRIADQNGIGFLPAVGDLERLPYKDNSFDICFCGWVLHHFPDINPVVKELHRVLKPGGKIAFVEPNESNLAMRLSRFVEDSLSKRVLKAGLDTPNRTKHSYRDYCKSLAQYQFISVKVGFCYPVIFPPSAFSTQKGGSKFLKIICYLRGILFSIARKVLPQPLNGADLLITGIKREE